MHVNRDGIVGVTWHDRRGLPPGTASPIDDHFTEHHFAGQNVRFRASVDGGASFLPSLQVNDEPSGRTTDFGHTQGLTPTPDGRFHAVWIDGRSGIEQVYTAAIRLRDCTRARESARSAPEGERRSSPALESAPDSGRSARELVSGKRFTPAQGLMEHASTPYTAAQRALAERHGVDPDRDGPDVVAALEAVAAHRPAEARRLLDEVRSTDSTHSDSTHSDSTHSDSTHSANRAWDEIDRLTRAPLRPYHAIMRAMDAAPGGREGVFVGVLALLFALGRLLPEAHANSPWVLAEPIVSGAVLLVFAYLALAEVPLSHLWVKVVPGARR